MTALHSPVWLWELTVRRWVSWASLALGLSVTLVWLAIFGAVVLAMTAIAPPAAGLAIEPGHLAHVKASPLTEWSIPAGRVQFDAYQFALDADDEIALAKVAAVTEWITVTDQQVVLVLLMDGDAVQVELLDGADVGHRGWLTRGQLVP